VLKVLFPSKSIAYLQNRPELEHSPPSTPLNGVFLFF